MLVLTVSLTTSVLYIQYNITHNIIIYDFLKNCVEKCYSFNYNEMDASESMYEKHDEKVWFRW